MRGLPAILFLGCALAAGCSRSEKEGYSPSYVAGTESDNNVEFFGVHPLHNPQRLFEVYGPIVEYLNGRVGGARLQLEASRSYEEFERKLYARHFHYALPNPIQTLESLPHGYRVFGKMGDDDQFRGLLIVRKDGGIEKVSDLKGKVVSFPARSALAATLMPLWFLRENGLDVNDGIQRLFSGSQESSIMNVYLGRSAAAATWPVPWRTFVELNPGIARELVVRWETSPLVNNGLVVRDDVGPDRAGSVAAHLLALHTQEEGRKLLAAIPLSRFEPATEETYAPVRDFLRRYREVVR